MKILYIECNMGAAGDMLMAALYELLDDREAFLNTINNLDIAEVKTEASIKKGIAGTRMQVLVNGIEEKSTDDRPIDKKDISSDSSKDGCNHGEGCSHKGLSDIENIIEALNLSTSVKSNAISVYKLLADAESSAHGELVSKIHFHEVGDLDAIVDIVGVCILIEKLAPDRIVVSPIHVGSGFVRCAHGLLPVPAPATANLLKGIPTYSTHITGELCTPTGAALLKHFADSFGSMPLMSVNKIGYGMGTKDFEMTNCVRAFWAETDYDSTNGQIAELCCNLDDMTGESVGYVQQLLFEAGARDVFTTPVQMKKGRPGVLLTCICDVDKADYFAALILKNTSTFGIRKSLCDRYELKRDIRVEATPYGEIQIKEGSGFGVSKCKAEYEDIAAVAKRNGVTLQEIQNVVRGMDKTWI